MIDIFKAPTLQLQALTNLNITEHIITYIKINRAYAMGLSGLPWNKKRKLYKFCHSQRVLTRAVKMQLFSKIREGRTSERVLTHASSFVLLLKGYAVLMAWCSDSKVCSGILEKPGVCNLLRQTGDKVSIWAFWVIAVMGWGRGWRGGVFVAGWLVNWTVNPVAKVQNFVTSGSGSFCSCKPTHEQTCHCPSHLHSCKTYVPRIRTWTFPTLQTVFAHQVTAHLHTQLQRIHLIQFFTRYVPSV